MKQMKQMKQMTPMKQVYFDLSGFIRSICG